MYYRQPRYYGEFQCIGGDCPDNCCYGWIIHWKAEEVEKVKNAPDISSELKALVEKSFVPVGENSLGYPPDAYKVEFNEHRKCPFQTEEGLCRIQKELGAEYLSRTCMNYPRGDLVTQGVFYRSCSSTCPVIIKKLLNQKDSMEMENMPITDRYIQPLQRQIGNQNIKKNPALEYYFGIWEFFYEILSNKNIPLDNEIVFGAIAAQKLTEITERKEYAKIPEALKAFRKQFSNTSPLIKSIEQIKPNYQVKFGFLTMIIEKVIGDGATKLLRDQTGELSVELYNKGKQGLREAMKERRFFLRNLALNLLLEFSVPFKFEDKTIYENYCLFVAAFGLLKLNLIAACSAENEVTICTGGQEFVFNGDDRLIGTTAIICRGICHNTLKEKVLIDILKENNIINPADLALLLK